MKSFFPFITLFLFLLVTSTINARKDVGEYWPRGVMKDQPLTEAASNEVTKINCHTTENPELKKVKNFVKDFKQPDISIYHNDIKPGQGKLFSKDFEPRTSISVYDNDDVLKEEKSFVKDFEPRPNISVYDNDVGLKEEKPFVDDFEPRPNISVYND